MNNDEIVKEKLREYQEVGNVFLDSMTKKKYSYAEIMIIMAMMQSAFNVTLITNFEKEIYFIKR